MSNQGQGLLLLAIAWLLLAAAGGYAQWRRGGNIGVGIVVTLFFGPLGLLVANYSGGRTCPRCYHRGFDRRATRCPKCQADIPAL
jgi:hypothetical protein